MEGNKSMMAIDRKPLKQKGDLAFDFHWADNIQSVGDIKEFFIH